MTGEKPSHTGAPSRGRRIEGADNGEPRPGDVRTDSGNVEDEHAENVTPGNGKPHNGDPHNGDPGSGNPGGANSPSGNSANAGSPSDGSGSAERLRIDAPSLADGSALYRITRDSGVLDVNSSYAYVLWCRDFARTSAVARADGVVVGFITGYLRPDAPDTLVVWQVAVDASQRGGGVAAKLLANLVDRVRARGARYLETTITADNIASIKLFSALARERSAELVRRPLFTPDLFPDAHESEDLYRIGPFAAVAGPPST